MTQKQRQILAALRAGGKLVRSHPMAWFEYCLIEDPVLWLGDGVDGDVIRAMQKGGLLDAESRPVSV